MSVPSWMWHLPILPVTPSAISSQGSEDGPTQPDLLGGPTAANCGPAPARVSRSRSRARSEEPTTSGTCGPTCFASSVPDGPLSSWESRLRQRLATAGSTECLLTWKASHTPGGRSLSRLVPSTPPIVVTVCGSSQSTEAALWITASARDWKDSPGMAAQRKDGRSRIDQLPRPVAAAMWATPTSLAPAKDGNNEAGNSAGLVAIRAHAVAAMWPTASDAARGSGTIRPQDTGIPLPQRVAQVLGTAQAGSSATTEKPGALNPAFVCWLMGFPAAWDACAPTAMPSSRKSRPK